MRNEKAVKKHKKDILMWLDSVEENMLKLQNESNDRKRAKLEKKIKSDKEMVVFVAKNLGKAGGSIEDVLPDLNDIKKQVISELFNQGTDSEALKNQNERNKIINFHKKRLNKLREAYEEYEMYDESLPIEEKLKNKIYKQEKEVGFFLYTESNKERKIYEPIWNYLEHIDETPEFTEEEKEILKRCYKIGEEYDKYKYEKIDMKLEVIGNFVGDSIRHYGDKRYVKGLSEDVFPEAIEKIIYPDRNLSRKEINVMGKILMARFIKYSLDEDAIIRYLNVLREVVSEVKGYDVGDLNNKELIELTDSENGLIFEGLKSKMNPEEAFFTYMYSTLSLEGRENLKYLDNYSLEELGLDVSM